MGVSLSRKGYGPRGHGVFPLHEELRDEPRPTATADRPSQGSPHGHQPELWDAGLLSPLAGQTGTGTCHLCGGGREGGLGFYREPPNNGHVWDQPFCPL